MMFTVKPVCLPYPNQGVPQGTMAFGAGWGRTHYDPNLPSISINFINCNRY